MCLHYLELYIYHLIHSFTLLKHETVYKVNKMYPRHAVGWRSVGKIPHGVNTQGSRKPFWVSKHMFSGFRSILATSESSLYLSITWNYWYGASDACAKDNCGQGSKITFMASNGVFMKMKTLIMLYTIKYHCCLCIT